MQHVEGGGQPTWVAVLSSPSVCRGTVLFITMQEQTRIVHFALDAYYAMLALDVTKSPVIRCMTHLI